MNEANRILTDDYLRAEYMLKLLGTELNDKTLKNILNVNELNDIVELYELIATTDDKIKLQEIHSRKSIEQQDIINKLSIAFYEENIVKALDLTVRLKYVTNLVKNIKTKKITTCK